MEDLPYSLQKEAELPSLEHVADIIPGGDEVKRSFILLRRALLVCSWNAASLEIVRLHMHIADMSILHLLFEEKEKLLLQGPLRSLLLAAHVFLYVMMRQVPKNGAVARTLVHRLEESIRLGQMSLDLWGDHLSALIWVLFVGAAVCEPPIEGNAKPWMWLQFINICRSMLPTTKEALMNVLKKFLWSDKGCASFLDRFWSLDLVER